MADQKLKFRDELENFAERSFGTSMAKLNDKQRSDALVLCYLMTIRNALLPGSIPDELDELQSYICDGKSDRMVDFLYRDDNNHVTIIQAKHRAPSRGETEAEFEAFKSCLKLLCPDTRPKTQINQKLLDVMSDIDWDTDSFTLIYLSLARHSEPIANSAEADLADIPNSSLKDISSRSELLYLSEDELNKEWRDVIGQRAGSSPTVEIRLSQPGKNEESEHPYLLFENPNGIRSYVGLLSAQQIHQLYNRYRDKMFNLNIRNYIGDTRTNKEIIKTAVEKGEDFFFYNNGISAVATKIIEHQDGKATDLSPKFHPVGSRVC